jgi:2-haloacid dehalogenase
METNNDTALLKPKLILFDVYETLLDMELIERRINGVLNSKRGYTLWFQVFMQYCFANNFMKTFDPFPAIAKATLQMTGKMLGTAVNENEAEEILQLLNHLPTKEAMPESLSILCDQDFRIAALTNVSQEIIDDRMERTGLISYFEAVLSTEEIKKYKPAAEVYQWALQKLEVDATDVLFVSAHPWDVAGAANVGMQTAFIEHPGEMLYPLAPAPTFKATNLEELSQTLSDMFAVNKKPL